MKKHFCLVLFLLFAFFLLSARPALAYIVEDVNSPLPDCLTSCASPNPGTCAKSEPGNCPSCGSDSADCCDRIGAWEKYQASCKEIRKNSCDWVWVYDTLVCSTADTCASGEVGLRPGYCDCTSGNSLYKACCNGTSPETCNGGDHTGTCPNETKFCGWGGYPSCATACNALPTSGALPTEPPEPTTAPGQQCGTCGQDWYNCTACPCERICGGLAEGAGNCNPWKTARKFWADPSPSGGGYYCDNVWPCKSLNTAPSNGASFNYGDDINFDWLKPTLHQAGCEPQTGDSSYACGDTWGVVCSSGQRTIPEEWGPKYVLELKYPIGKKPTDCDEDGDYCVVGWKERGIYPGEDFPGGQDPRVGNFNYQGIAKKIIADHNPTGDPCSGGTYSCNHKNDNEYWCKCVLSWYWDKANGTKVSYDALDNEGALMFEVAPGTNRFVYSNFSPRGETAEGRKYQISFDAMVSKGARGVRVVLRGGTTGESGEQTFNLSGNWVRYTTNYFPFNEGQSSLRLSFYGRPNGSGGTRQRVWIDNVSVYSDYIDSRTGYLLTDDLPGGTYQWRIKNLVNVGDTDYSMWSYSDPWTFTVVQPTGTIKGNVYRNNNCQCSGSASPPDKTWVVTCAGDGINGTVTARRDDNRSFTCVDENGSDQLIYGDYTVVFSSPSTNWTSVCGVGQCCASSKTVTLASGQENVSPFYQCQKFDAWFQSEGGDLHANGSLTSLIPSTCVSPSCNPYLSLAADSFNGLVSAANSINWGDGAGAGEVSNWYAEGENIDLSGLGYQYFDNLLINEGDGDPVLADGKPASGVYKISGDQTIDDVWNVGSNDSLVILVDGSLNINRNVNIASGGFLTIIASGDISIGETVTNVEGAYIADGNLITEGTNNAALVAEGMFVGLSGVSLNRRFNNQVDNNTKPVETFTYRPDLFMNAPDVLKKSRFNWQEVAP